MFRQLRTLLVSFFVLIVCSISYAQNAQIQGQITDSSGAVISNALVRVLIELDIEEARVWLDQSPAFATMFSLAATRWQIAPQATLSGYLWAWNENQVLAAIKLVPLGQSAGQRLLHRLVDVLPDTVERALALPEDRIGVSGISQAMASALHESQYSRLFRS